MIAISPWSDRSLPELAYLALGSNLGDRVAHLRAAREGIERWPETVVVGRSRVYETAPIGAPGQGPYLNQVLAVRTNLSPKTVLFEAKRLETERKRPAFSPVKWDSRTLDVDLLFYGEQVMDSQELTVPHPRLHERSFVLSPLAELAPDLRHPVLSKTIKEMSLAVGSEGLIGVFNEASATEARR
ncbi:2-amino-4-hydroxy-6-hydroxymethyldihydropteridine diphosphokinase [Mucisphaera sp.]|uniref:2-amino-4-hydroxy-6- hydroxymethyldihydropteridine diphosphokinase n=1 Tax=Mucisphaera sp. TaxID=2913024 RepID=UPI003D1069F7